MNLFDFLPLIVFFSFIVITTRNILYLTFLWQMKEYRVDRVLAHLRTPQGKKLIAGPKALVKWILFLVIFVSVFLPWRLNGYLKELLVIGEIAYFLFWLVWIGEAIIYIREFILSGWRIPKFTVKIIFTLLTLFIFISFFLIDQDFISVTIRILYLGPFIDRFIGIFLVFITLVFNLPSFFYKKTMTIMAKRKIANFKDLTVIGITGSFGKTSTKEFLATILGEKFRVAKTPEFNNTEIGVAKYILNNLTADHEIFVVEMGAYKRGEIKEICDIVRPQIGIITGINEQHASLFGSLENTRSAKFELVGSLPQNGTALFNGDNMYCLEMAKLARDRGITTIIYSRKKEIKDIKIFRDHIEFRFMDKGKTYAAKVAVLGDHFTTNLLAGIRVSELCGMENREITRGLAKIVAPLHTMELSKTSKTGSLVDDTFNANSDGVIAALNYMKIFKGKKILVLTPLIEIGDRAEKIHELLGEEVAQVCDMILLTNINYNKSFVIGARRVDGEKKVQIVNTAIGVKLVRENLGKDGVAVFEGKEAAGILAQLDSK